MKFKESCDPPTPPTELVSGSEFVKRLAPGTVFGKLNCFYVGTTTGGAFGLSEAQMFQPSAFDSYHPHGYKVYPDATLVYGKPQD